MLNDFHKIAIDFSLSFFHIQGVSLGFDCRGPGKKEVEKYLFFAVMEIYIKQIFNKIKEQEGTVTKD